MAHTIFILGTDPQQCKALGDILRAHVADNIVTASSSDKLPRVQEQDTVIITAEEKNTGVLYRRLLNKLEQQVHRAQFLSELIHLFSSSLRVEEILEKVVTKSTEVLGDTAFVVLNAEGQVRLEAAFSADRDRLIKMLMTTINITPQGLAAHLGGVLDRGEPVMISSLAHELLTPETRDFVDKYSVISLLATPIPSKERILGAFITTSSSRNFTEEDLKTAVELSDFAAIALENARLFSELQRSAITDPLTGLYNTRFFHEVLARELARADRYSTPLSLLMIDVDGFKVVNDSFGHVVGNKVLNHVARIIERTVRNTDFVFRCGGDEFGVVLPGTNVDGAMRAAEKILNRVAAAEILPSLGYSGAVTVSVGVSEYRRGHHLENLVAEADQALYASKRSSKNCARAYGK